MEEEFIIENGGLLDSGEIQSVLPIREVRWLDSGEIRERSSVAPNIKFLIEKGI